MNIATFGELMLQLTPPQSGDKISSSSRLKVDYVGAEANDAASLAILGNEVKYITKLPSNTLGDAAIQSLKKYGISCSGIKRGGDRIGVYYTEMGKSIRPSSVIYDRKGSSVSKIETGEFDWEEILSDVSWVHLSGITPALSESCANEVISIAKIAQQLGVKVCFDLNYRRTLWNNGQSARKIFDQIIDNTNLIFGNIGVMKDVYDISIGEGNSADQSNEVIIKSRELFGDIDLAFTVRDHYSASSNKVGGIIYTNQVYISKTYDVEITDRFGTGDAFSAGILHALGKGLEPQKLVDFATAAFALKHTIRGDQNTSSEEEIISIMKGDTSGYVKR